MTNLKARLRKVEKQIARSMNWPRDSPKEKFCSSSEAANWVYTTMSEEHQRIVINEVTRYDGWLETDPLLRKGDLPHVGRLTEIFLLLTAQAAYFNIRPYALPPEVAEVYLKDSQASPCDECEKCGYRVPVARAVDEFKQYFPLCPLCGGRTGKDFWQEHRLDYPCRLQKSSWIYAMRRREYHEKCIQLFCEVGTEFTRKDAIDCLAEDTPDIRKYVS